MFYWFLVYVLYANTTVVSSTKIVDDCLVILAVIMLFLSNQLDRYTEQETGQRAQPALVLWGQSQKAKMRPRMSTSQVH